MSNIPYNNFTILDLNGVQQPYVNSTTEVGYFTGSSVGPILQNRWRSLPAVLNTNNGIASVDASGLTILNPGVYSIKLSLFPTSTQDGSSNISFNFGTRYLYDVSTNVVANSFGGVRPTGMFTYDASNNPYIPGIITWVADGYSSGNTGSNFVKTQTNELSYNYSTAGTGGQIFSGICTTEMTFVIVIPKTIYFNVSTNSTAGVTMGNCVFTLQLISSYSSNIFWTPQTLLLTDNSLPTANWNIASSSDGTKLAATAGGTGGTRGIYVSKDSGLSWSNTDASSNVNWNYIASSSDGFRLAAVVFGGGIYTSINSGTNWLLKTSGTLNSLNWTSIASSSDGTKLAATSGGTGGTRGIYVSTNSGNIWEKTLASSFAWRCITISSDGTKLAAVVAGSTTNDRGIYVSTDPSNNFWRKTGALTLTWTSIASSSNGETLVATASNGHIYRSTDPSNNDWTPVSADTAEWNSIASSSDGQYLAAVASGTSGGIWVSTNFGSDWVKQINLPNLNWASIASSSDGLKLAAGALSANAIYTSAYT